MQSKTGIQQPSILLQNNDLDTSVAILGNVTIQVTFVPPQKVSFNILKYKYTRYLDSIVKLYLM